MRKNTFTIMEAWNFDRAKGKAGDSIWTDGQNVYSYQTCILVYGPNGSILNVGKYSRTTSTHQNGVKEWLANAAMKVTEVGRTFPRGTTSADLSAAQREGGTSV